MGDQPLAEAAKYTAQKHKRRSSLLSEGFENMNRKIKRPKTFLIIRSGGREQNEKRLSVGIILKCGTQILLDRPHKFCGQKSGVKDVAPCRNQTPVTHFTLRSVTVYTV
jgi:hypothetical protein